MQELYYENQGTNTYLVCEIEESDPVDTMSLGMLTNNRIPGLAPSIFTQMDTKKYVKYNVSAKVPVKELFSGAVNKKRLLGVFSGIVEAMLSAEEYMLDASAILLDMGYIFTDVSSCETVLICLPIVDETKPAVDLGAFFRTIMFNTQFDQTEDCDHVARIINYLNSASAFSLPSFKQLLEEIRVGRPRMEGQTVRRTAPQPQVGTETQPLTRPAAGPSAPPRPNPAPQAARPVPPAQAGVGQAPPQAGARQTPPQAARPVPPVRPIPPSQPAVPPMGYPGQQPMPQQTQSEGEHISLFYLLQHYNKENAAAYKAQKEQKKGGKQAKSPKPPKGGKAPAAAQRPGGPTYAIPGQPQPIPGGQPAPAQQPIQRPPQPPQTRPAPVAAPAPAGAYGGQAPMPGQTPMGSASGTPPAAAQGQRLDFGNTSVLSAGMVGQTTVLTSAQGGVQGQPIVAYLLRVKNREKIPLSKPVFRVGKERSYVDYFIGDNTAISRSHANFITREGEYFVVDTNSTNHTFVNGVMIRSSEEIKLKHGDKICLANEEFEFRLY